MDESAVKMIAGADDINRPAVVLRIRLHRTAKTQTYTAGFQYHPDTQGEDAMKLLPFLLLALMVSNTSAAQALADDPLNESMDTIRLGDSGPPRAVAEVRKFVASYRAAELRRDKAVLLDAFFSKDTSVVGSVSTESYARMVANGGAKAPKLFLETGAGSATGDADPKNPPQQISNVSVQTDGAIATVNFDYAIKGGYGKQTWLLVRAKEAWKIIGIAYSINLGNGAAQ